jgi:hypothetical protein
MCTFSHTGIYGYGVAPPAPVGWYILRDWFIVFCGNFSCDDIHILDY